MLNISIYLVAVAPLAEAKDRDEVRKRGPDSSQKAGRICEVIKFYLVLRALVYTCRNSDVERLLGDITSFALEYSL